MRFIIEPSIILASNAPASAPRHPSTTRVEGVIVVRDNGGEPLSH